MKIKFALILILCGVLLSCKTTPVMDIKPNILDVDEIINPQINITTKRSVGVEMIATSKIFTSETIEILSDIADKVPKGIYIDKGYYEPDIEVYRNEIRTSMGQIVEYDLYKISGVFYYGIPFGKKQNLKVINKNDISIKKNSFIEADNFQQTLIYCGRSGNNIYFTYCEFSDNKIRDAFTMNYIYDLSLSNTIGIKNASFLIQEATNEYIVYKVISSF